MVLLYHGVPMSLWCYNGVTMVLYRDLPVKTSPPPPEGASNPQTVLRHAGAVSAHNWWISERLCGCDANANGVVLVERARCLLVLRGT